MRSLSMPLVNAILHLFLRLIELARLPLFLQLADNLLKEFHDLQAAPSFDAFDVQFHLAGFADGDFKFALGHKFSK